MLVALAVILCLVGLVISSYTDFRTREVPDWLNFSLIATGIGIRLLYSAVLWDYHALLEGLYGLGLGVLLAYIMFYTGQWGGGDSKMLMGLGVLLGLPLHFNSLFVSFLIDLLFVGAVYGFLWSIILALRHRKGFVKTVGKYTKTKVFLRMRILGMVLAVSGIAASFFIADFWQKLLVLLVALMFYVMLYLWVFVKSVEDSCMLKYVAPTKLTEGDWIAEEITVNGKYLCGPKDLGLTKEKMSVLLKLYAKKKIKRVLIKEGIPFVPSFLAAFLVMLAFGNLILLMLR